MRKYTEKEAKILLTEIITNKYTTALTNKERLSVINKMMEVISNSELPRNSVREVRRNLGHKHAEIVHIKDNGKKVVKDLHGYVQKSSTEMARITRERGFEISYIKNTPTYSIVLVKKYKGPLIGFGITSLKLEGITFKGNIKKQTDVYFNHGTPLFTFTYVVSGYSTS